jgi:hypothetical protein
MKAGAEQDHDDRPELCVGNHGHALALAASITGTCSA